MNAQGRTGTATFALAAGLALVVLAGGGRAARVGRGGEAEDAGLAAAWRQDGMCAGTCERKEKRAARQCKNRALCKVARCKKAGMSARGYVCKRKGSSGSGSGGAGAAATPTPAGFTPRFKKVVICRSGRNVYNVGVVDVEDMVHVAMFARSAERAGEFGACIRRDRAAVSVEEYLAFARDNCVGEEPANCAMQPGGGCECRRSPVRCTLQPFRRAVDRCELVG